MVRLVSLKVAELAKELAASIEAADLKDYADQKDGKTSSEIPSTVERKEPMWPNNQQKDVSQMKINSQVSKQPLPREGKIRVEPKMPVESLGFDKDFLEFEADEKEKILYSEQLNPNDSKRYEKVDFSKLDDLRFETNKADNDVDLLDLDPNQMTGNGLKPTREEAHEDSSSDSDSDSKEYSDSGFGVPEDPNYKPFEDKPTNDEQKQNEQANRIKADDFLDF